MHLMAKDIVKKIEKDLDYPGQIKVNVIRETRSVDYAKVIKESQDWLLLRLSINHVFNKRKWGFSF